MDERGGQEVEWTEWTRSMGEKATTAMRSEAGAGERATMGKRGLGGHAVELC